MSRAEIWISVTCTDRSASLRALAGDLLAQSTEADVALVLLVNDNSVQSSEQAANQALGSELRHAGVAVDVIAALVSGTSIAASRRRQREQVRARLAAGHRPKFVWMLDDDVRLSHLYWTGDALDVRPLHCHVAFLLQLAVRHPELAVLIGEVCGDPPIPVIGSAVSRLSDLEANLTAMFGASPEAAWQVGAATLPQLAEADAYYDLSHARGVAAWKQEVRWLPRGGPVDTRDALLQMIAEVEHIPRGAAFSRPILAAPARFDKLVSRPRRGGNAVFFDVDRCLEHAYPSIVVGDIETRRSDMIGTTRLSDDGVTVRGSGFSVLHQRARTAAWPNLDELTVSLVADTLGAWLARASDPQVADDAASTFLAERLARVQAAAQTLAALTARLRRLVATAPTWAPPLEPVLEVADWALQSYPGARDGTIPRDVVEALHANATPDSIARSVRDLAEGRAA